MNVLSEELKRALTSRGMRMALLLGIGLLIVGLNYAITYPPEKSFIDVWYIAYSQFFYYLMLPLIACIPFADTLTSDRKQGYLERLVVRERYKNVLNAKFFRKRDSRCFSLSFTIIVTLFDSYTYQS